MMKPPLVVLLVLLGCTLSWAQFSSSVQGTVRDAGGAVLTNAEVHLRNLGTDVVNQVSTTEGGFYRFNSLPIGRYSVTVEAKGFRSQVVEVTITAGESRNVDVTMEIATAHESVKVTSEASLVDTTETRIHLSISEEKLQDLPVLSNNLIGLMSMAPGVVGNNDDQGDNFTNEYAPSMSASAT